MMMMKKKKMKKLNSLWKVENILSHSPHAAQHGYEYSPTQNHKFT